MPGRSSNTGNPHDNYKFTGYEKDDEADLTLYHAEARGYDPVLGRFLQIDPHAAKYPSLSPYAYVANNPLVYTDPDGRDIAYGTRDEADRTVEDLNRLYKRQFGVEGAFSVGTRTITETQVNEDGEEVEVETTLFTLETNSDFDWESDDYTKAMSEVINSDEIVFGAIISDSDKSLLSNKGGGEITGANSFNVSGQLANVGDAGTISLGNPSKHTLAGVTIHEITYHLHPQGTIDYNRSINMRKGGVLYKGVNGAAIMRTRYSIKRGSPATQPFHGPGPYSNIKRWN